MDPQVGTTAGQAPAQPGGSGQAPAAPTTPPAAPSASTDAERGDEHDPERARALIAKLRPYETLAKTQAKELETLRNAQREREEADLSEQQKLAKRAERAEQEAAGLKGQLEALAFRSAVAEMATRLGFVDTDAATKLLDASAVQRDAETGEVDGRSLRAALEKLGKERSWLLNKEAAAQQAELQRTEAQRNSRGLPATPPGRTPQPTDGVAEARNRLAATGEYRSF